MSADAAPGRNYRCAATYADKTAQAAQPAHPPMEQPTRIELVINRKAATALGIALPHDLLLRAEEVIE